jgi:hypothetical protein
VNFPRFGETEEAVKALLGPVLTRMASAFGVAPIWRPYAKFLDGVREHANRLIEQSMQEWGRVSQGEATEG